MSAQLTEQREKRVTSKPKKPMENDFVRNEDDVEDTTSLPTAKPKAGKPTKHRHHPLISAMSGGGGGGRHSPDEGDEEDQHDTSSPSHHRRHRAGAGGGDDDDDPFGGDDDDDDDDGPFDEDDVSLVQPPRRKKYRQHRTSTEELHAYIQRDMDERNPRHPVKRLLHLAHIGKQTDFCYGEHSTANLPAALRTIGSGAGFMSQLLTAAIKHRLTAEAHALTNLQSMAFQRANTPGKRWHPVALYVTYLLASYYQSLDPRDLEWSGDTVSTIESFNPAPASDAQYRPPNRAQANGVSNGVGYRQGGGGQAPNWSNNGGYRNQQRGGQGRPRGSGGFIANTRIPAPIPGVFCPGCGLHGWGKREICPRCREDNRTLWLGAHQALPTDGIVIPGNTPQPPIIQ